MRFRSIRFRFKIDKIAISENPLQDKLVKYEYEYVAVSQNILLQE